MRLRRADDASERVKAGSTVRFEEGGVWFEAAGILCGGVDDVEADLFGLGGVLGAVGVQADAQIRVDLGGALGERVEEAGHGWAAEGMSVVCKVAV